MRRPLSPNKVVARYQDGRVLKGFTSDFLPNKEMFHLELADAPHGSRPVEVRTAELKAVFFVKDFAGNPGYKDSEEFDAAKPPVGRKIKVLFTDGELLVGTTQGYQPGRAGFFVIPADPRSNIERCYVVTAAAHRVVLG
jgi:hypothetical protein